MHAQAGHAADAAQLVNVPSYGELPLPVLKVLGPGEYAVVDPPADTEPAPFSLTALDYTHSAAQNCRFANAGSERTWRARWNGSSASQPKASSCE